MSPPDIRSITDVRIRKHAPNYEHLGIINDVACQAVMWVARSWGCGIPFDPSERGEGKNINIIESSGIFGESGSAIEVDIV
jgi:hypothetical protein